MIRPLREECAIMSDPIPMAQPKILLLEEHALVRAALCDLVNTRFAHCRFLEAKNLEEALKLAADQSPDIVLIDVGWPVMADIEATRQIKAMAPHAQVALLSLYDDLSYRIEAAAAGVDAIVSRPRIALELIRLLGTLPSMSTRSAAVMSGEASTVDGNHRVLNNRPRDKG
jgi:DNA-binding NarL/FixJ family response regulator